MGVVPQGGKKDLAFFRGRLAAEHCQIDGIQTLIRLGSFDVAGKP